MTVTIMGFRREHAATFEALNRQWLVDHELLEAADEPHLVDPQGQIIDAGGAIFVALDGERVSGTCAIVPVDDAISDARVFELVKLAVDPAARGRGIGRQLVDACLAFAREHGASRVELLSSSRLTAALRLYEQVGFRYAPLPPSNPYVTADVYMVIDW
jgi:ribosomal protein S18 acetylase RimI-like enzyme